MNEKKTEKESESSKKAYEQPRLTRWGTLRELTRGGGGLKNEPGPGNPNTRF